MAGHVFLVLGDLSRLAADAIGFSTDRQLGGGGHLYAAYRDHLPGFAEGLAAVRPAAMLEIGDTRWIPLSGRPRGVVAAAVAGSTRIPRAERAAMGVTNSLRTAAEALRGSGPGPWLVGLPGYLLGKGGAWRDRTRVIEPQLLAAAAFVKENPEFDVAFVIYTEGNHRLWQAERRRLLGVPAVDLPPPMVAALRSGECALFIGSGVSIGSGLPSWSVLCAELSKTLGVSPPSDVDGFLDLAQWYRDAELSPSIEDIVSQRFQGEVAGARPGLAHYLIAGLPVRYFVTSNYDDLLEMAIEGCGRSARTVVDEHDVVRTSGSRGRFVVKFHGDARRTGDGVVLSRDDYDELFRRRPAMALLLEGLLLNHAFLFVGYSLRDPDFRQIFGRIGSMLREAQRPAYAPTFEQNPHVVRQWAAKNVHLLPVSGDDYGAKARGLLMWLDALNDAATAESGAILAYDVHPPQSLAGIRAGLLSLESALQGACAGANTELEARFLSDLLLLFARWGYRGESPGQLSAMLTTLSEILTGDEAAMLVECAMLHAEMAADVVALRAKLDAISPGPRHATAGASPSEKPR